MFPFYSWVLLSEWTGITFLRKVRIGPTVPLFPVILSPSFKNKKRIHPFVSHYLQTGSVFLFYIKKCLENVGHGGESDVDVK